MFRVVLLTISAFAIGVLSPLFAQPKLSREPFPKFHELSAADAARLKEQRAVVESVARQHYGSKALTRTTSDLPLLQKLIDDKVFDKSQTYELQCLGVAFGDVLAGELPLHWVMVTDEYGTDPTLRFKKTTTNINALTMISKRLEQGKPVNLAEMLKTTRVQLSKMEGHE